MIFPIFFVGDARFWSLILDEVRLESQNPDKDEPKLQTLGFRMEERHPLLNGRGKDHPSEFEYI